MVAAALIDRLVHHATMITLKGKSYDLRERGLDVTVEAGSSRFRRESRCQRCSPRNSAPQDRRSRPHRTQPYLRPDPKWCTFRLRKLCTFRLRLTNAGASESIYLPRY
jgi:hypothetical protein